MKYLIFPVLLGLGLAGCSSSTKESTQVTPADTTTSAPSAPAVLLAANPAPLAATATPTDRSIIYQGELDLVVDDFAKASASIDQLLEEHQAYLLTAHETRADGQHRQQMTLKVLPSEFLRVVSALSKLGRIENKDVTSADVTADVLATNQRSSDAQASAARYRQQAAQASNPAQARHLQEQALQAQQEAATAQQQAQLVGAKTKWATLTLRFYQPLPDVDPGTPAPSFAPRFAAAFAVGWSAMMSVLVVLAYVWPLLVLAGAAVGAARWWRQRHPAQA